MLIPNLSVLLAQRHDVTTVETVTPAPPHRRTNSTVPRDAATILTMLLPIRMVDIS